MAKTHPPRPAAADYIYQALVELMDKKPYDQITVTDIVKKAGVSRMTFYRHYRDKDDILIGRYRKRFSKNRENMTRESPREYWLRNIQQNDQEPLFALVIRAGLLDQAFGLTLDIAKTFYQTVYGLDMTDERSLLLVYQKLGALFGYLIYRRDRPGQMSPDALADHLAELMALDVPVPLAEDGGRQGDKK